MEVTSENFKKLLPEVSQAIKDADFLSMDGEFTGLSTGDKIHPYETPEERYLKLKKTALDFLFVQFGLCSFQYDQSQNKYICKAFNFYVFPRPFSRQAPDIRFTCQSSSIDFLMAQGFDFNKVFRKGISYLNTNDEQKLRESLIAKHVQQRNLAAISSSPAFSSPNPSNNEHNLAKGPIQVSDEHKPFINAICDKIEDFLKSEQQTLPLEQCNAFLRKLLYQTVALKFKSQVHLETKISEKKERYIVVTRISGENDAKKLEEAKRQAELDELDDAVGFSKVIKMISESGKLLIGHNMLLDLLHMLDKFRCPLPDDYEEFKAMTKCIFPRILDTKVMASSHPFKDFIFNTSLGDMQKCLEMKPFTKPVVDSAEGFPSYSLSSEKLHEAGYDAYITGICFISMANYLGRFQEPKVDIVPAGSPLLGTYFNKIFLMRIYDIPYINICGPDNTPSRDHVFHVTFPAEWTTQDLFQLFSPFGTIQYAYLSDTTAFCGLYRKDNADQVLKSIPSSDLYKVISYADYMEQKSIAHATPSTDRNLKRKIPNSDVDLPTKRKRQSSDRLSPAPLSHNITTIPEEDESMEDEKTAKSPACEKKGANGNAHDDQGVPLKKRVKNFLEKVKSETTKSSDENKMFEEPDNWA